MTNAPPNPHLAVLRLILDRADATAAIFMARNVNAEPGSFEKRAYGEASVEWQKLANGLRAWLDLADPPSP